MKKPSIRGRFINLQTQKKPVQLPHRTSLVCRLINQPKYSLLPGSFGQPVEKNDIYGI